MDTKSTITIDDFKRMADSLGKAFISPHVHWDATSWYNSFIKSDDRWECTNIYEHKSISIGELLIEAEITNSGKRSTFRKIYSDVDYITDQYIVADFTAVLQSHLDDLNKGV